MANLQLNAQPRDPKVKAKALIRTGLVPAIVYGHGQKNTQVALDPKVFSKLFTATGESSLIDLAVEGQSNLTVLVKDVQYDLLKRTPVHVDFQQVRMDELITVEVGLKLVGESPVVKSDGAVLVESLHSLKVECLPVDLQHEIEVDISGLIKVGQVIHVKDLSLRPSWKLVGHELDDVVLSVMEPKVEAEPVPVVAEVAPVEGEAPASSTESEITDKADKKDSKKSEAK